MYNGLQPLVLEIMGRFPANERIFTDGCALVLLLTVDAISHNKSIHSSPRSTFSQQQDEASPISATSIGPWNTRALVELFASATLGFADSLSFDAICQKMHEVLQCLYNAPQLSDVSEAGELGQSCQRLASIPSVISRYVVTFHTILLYVELRTIVRDAPFAKHASFAH